MVSYHRLLLSLFLILPMAVFAEDRNIWCYQHKGEGEKINTNARLILRDQEPRIRVKCDGRCVTVITTTDVAGVTGVNFVSDCFEDFGILNGLLLNGNGDDDVFINDNNYFGGSCTSSKCNNEDLIVKILDRYRSDVRLSMIRYHPPSDYSAANPLNFSIINLASGLLLTLLITYAGLY